MAKTVKIVFVGAGSAVFSKNIIADIFSHESLKNAKICLVDINKERLETVEAMSNIIAKQLEIKADISSTEDRRSVLEGADFVISCIGVGGLEATKIDHKIPAKFGLNQIVGDTLGIGGIFRAIRGIPELLRIAEDIKELCPDALLINYSNPMAMHCLALARATKIKYAGLCHGVKNTAQIMRMYVAMLETSSPEEIQKHFELPHGSPERETQWKLWVEKGLDAKLNYTCAGINHMAFFLDFKSGEENLYPGIWKALQIPHLHRLDPVRFELFKRLGYFMTETSGHTAEYLPYFLKNKEDMEKHFLKPSWYLNACEELETEYQDLRKTIQANKDIITTPYSLSVEYVSHILNAIVTNEAYVFNGNVHNRDGALISNLPGDSCVEVPCVVNKQGIQPTVIGDLPPQCAAMIRTNVNVQDLTVRGILEGRRDYIYQAAMLDPNTASKLNLDEIDSLVAEMFATHEELLPESLKR